MTTWTVTPEAFDSPAASSLRRDYYADVAGSYWKRPATPAEIEAGLAEQKDELPLLAPPTGQFVVGRYGDVPAACGGVVMLAGGRGELTRIFVRPPFRGTGGGGHLLARLEEQARALGAHTTVLNTRFDLVEARGLYVHHGYGEIPAYRTGGPYEDVWYGKSL